MNLVLAVLCLLGFGLWVGIAGGHWFPSVQADHVLFGNVRIFFIAGTCLNIMLLIFNLVPVPPLDGSRIMANLYPAYREFVYGERGGNIAAVGTVLLFLFGGTFIFGTALDITMHASDFVVRVMVPSAQPRP